MNLPPVPPIAPVRHIVGALGTQKIPEAIRAGLPGTLVRIMAASTGPEGLVEAVPPTTESFDVRGIMSQYAPSGTGGYQLLPRLASDLVLDAGLGHSLPDLIGCDVTLRPGDQRWHRCGRHGSGFGGHFIQSPE